MRLLLTLFLLSSFSLIQAQRGNTLDFGARSLSLGGISTTLDGSDALFANFAQVAFDDRYHVIASTSRRFNLSELTTSSIAGSYPIQGVGHLGARFTNYGFEGFKEQQLSIKYARKLLNSLSIGAHFDLNLIQIEGLGSNSTLSFGVAFAGRIDENTTYGISIFNPEKVEITTDSEIASAIRVGLSRSINSKLKLYLDAEKIIDAPLNIIAGVEYQPAELLQIRLGTSTNPGSISFGLGYTIGRNLRLDGGSQYSTLLGFTPGASINYSGKTIPYDDQD